MLLVGGKVALILAGALGSVPAAAVHAQESAPGIASMDRIDRPVGEALHPARVFLDVAWARSLAAPGENDQLLREAFIAAQMAQRSLSGASISQMAARLAEGDDAFAAALRARQETSEQVEALRNRLAEATRFDDKAALQAESGRLQSAMVRLAEQDERLLRDYPNYANIVQQRPVPLDELRTKLRPKEGLIYIADGDKGLYVFVVTAERTGWFRSAMTADRLEDAVTLLRCQLEIPACGRDKPLASYDRGKAFEVYQAIFAPPAAHLAGKDSLIVITNRSLSRFPVAALVTEQTDRRLDADAADLRRGNWLIDRYALTVVPSPSALHHLRSLPGRGRGGRSFRGFGDPVFDEPTEQARERRRRFGARGLTRGGSGAVAVDTEELKKEFGDLPYSAKELDALRRTLGARPETVSLGEEATETAVRAADLRDVAILALATHGVLGGEVSWVLEPALIFTPPANATDEDDGVLTASEAAKLRLSADLVILSACNTAGPSGYEGPAVEGLSGLARGFFFAGARSLLVSHWRVYDEVAAELTVKTVEALASPRADKASALQQAMIAVRQKPGKDWSHPSAWAAFVLVGDSK